MANFRSPSPLELTDEELYNLRQSTASAPEAVEDATPAQPQQAWEDIAVPQNAPEPTGLEGAAPTVPSQTIQDIISSEDVAKLASLAPKQTDVEAAALTSAGVQAAPVAKPLTPEAQKRAQLVQAINATRESPEAETPAQMHSRKAAQAFYAMSQGKSLPDSFFAAPPVKDTLIEDQRRLMQAQTAKALSETAGKGVPLNAEDVQSTKAFIASLPENLANAEQKAALSAKAESNPKEARLMANSIMSNVGKNVAREQQDRQFAETQGLKKQQFLDRMEFEKLKNTQAGQQEANKQATELQKEFQKDGLISALSSAEVLDKGLGGRLSSDVPLSDSDLKLNPFDLQNRINQRFKGIPGMVEEKALSLQNNISNILNGRSWNDITPEEKKRVQDLYQSDTKLASMNSAIHNIYNQYRHQLAGSAVSEQEIAFVDKALQSQWGASPAEQMAALQVLLKGMAKTVVDRYANLESMAATDTRWRTYLDQLYKRKDILSPANPLIQKFAKYSQANEGPPELPASGPPELPTTPEERAAAAQSIGAGVRGTYMGKKGVMMPDGTFYPDEAK